MLPLQGTVRTRGLSAFSEPDAVAESDALSGRGARARRRKRPEPDAHLLGAHPNAQLPTRRRARVRAGGERVVPVALAQLRRRVVCSNDLTFHLSLRVVTVSYKCRYEYIFDSGDEQQCETHPLLCVKGLRGEC